MKNNKGILSAVGHVISKAGEIGVKTGDAIKEFGESGAAEKAVDNLKQTAKSTVNDAVEGVKFAADGVASGVHVAADKIKANAEENAKKRAEKAELRKEIKAELEAEKARKNDEFIDSEVLDEMRYRLLYAQAVEHTEGADAFQKELEAMYYKYPREWEIIKKHGISLLDCSNEDVYRKLSK